MYQRGSERDPARSVGERRVGLFVDFDSIRRGFDDQLAGADPADIAQRLRDLAQEQGRVLIACAYGDWAFSRAHATELRRQRIEPRLVLSKDPGDDRSDLVLSLDVQETLYLGPDLDVFVLVSGESYHHELSQRLRRADRNVVLVGFDANALPPNFRGGDRFVPLEELLGIRRARRLVRKVDFSMFDWAPFIRLMDDLEKNMPFVGFGWLLKKKLTTENSGSATPQDRQEMMDRAVDEGVLILYKVDNIEEGADPVTACKLNRESPRVKELVEA